MRSIGRTSYVLAVYPNTRGFAFTLFESTHSLADWGVREVRGTDKNAGCLARVQHLVERHRPHVLVLQNTFDGGTRRAARITELNSQIVALGTANELRIVSYSRHEVSRTFNIFGASSKHEIALAIANRIKTLARYVPPRRKAWMAEPARMALFDAAALALTFFHHTASAT